MSHNKIGIVIPAWNEEHVIVRAIESAANQDHHATTIVVAVDNSTDRTFDHASRLKGKYPELQVFRTLNNDKRKAGALNQAIDLFLLNKVDYVMVLDADTVADAQVTGEAIRILSENPHLGAICARTHLTPLPQTASLSQKLLWRLQKLEYATADSRRIQKPESFQILAGSCVIYRMSALKEVADQRGNGQYYDEASLIEDYELTISLKELGWKVTIGTKMLSWTDVPTTFKSHWQQRLRWARSHVDTLRQRGWNHITGIDILGHTTFIFLLTQQLAFAILLVYLLFAGTTLVWNPYLWLVLGLFWFDRFYRIKFVYKPDIIDVIIKVLYFPEELYGLIHTVQRVQAYLMSIFHSREEWLET